MRKKDYILHLNYKKKDNIKYTGINIESNQVES